MGLKEVQEELKKQIEEAQKVENVVEDNDEEVVKQDEETVEEKQEETKETEKTEDEKPKKTNADYARERREKLSREQRLADELAAAQARIAELSKTREEVKRDDDPAPNRDEDPVAFAEWKARQAEKKAEAAVEMAKKAEERFTQEDRRKQAENLVQQAQAELVGYENEFKTSAKDYEDVKNYYVNSLAFSIKKLNPRITNDALTIAVNNQLMLEASQLYNEGYENPIAEIYARTKGEYDDFKAKLPKTQEVEEKTPDLSRVAKNRERNAGMAAASGGGNKGEVTKRYAATEMTSQEWAKLPKAERERILRQ